MTFSILILAAALGAITLVTSTPALVEQMPRTITNNNTEVYVDPDSTVQHGSFVSFWVRNIFLILRLAEIALKRGCYFLDCRTGQDIMHHFVELKESGRIVYDYGIKKRKIYTVPNNLGLGVYNFICRQQTQENSLGKAPKKTVSQGYSYIKHLHYSAVRCDILAAFIG